MDSIWFPTLRRLLGGTLLLGVVALGQQAAPRPPRPEFEPIEDQEGLPRILLVGDSISMGYTLPTRKLLEGRANVHRIPANGGPTSKGVENLARWLGEGKWDVIHFNWGLHDLKGMPDGTLQVSLEDYEKNLRTLVEQLKATGAALVWASTTPVPEGDLSPPRRNEDVIRYNEVAAKVMAENGVRINDLYAFCLPQLADLQRPVNVHFTAKGSAALAEQVASVLAEVLPRK